MTEQHTEHAVYFGKDDADGSNYNRSDMASHMRQRAAMRLLGQSSHVHKSTERTNTSVLSSGASAARTIILPACCLYLDAQVQHVL